MDRRERKAAKQTSGPSVDSKCAVELVNATTAAGIAGISRRSWSRLVSEGRAPQPIRLGRCVRWRVAELRGWILAGCSY
jgi:predicted DNA-binding transcriptional regulator AlpA